MKSLMAGFGALAVWAVLALPASAGWDNVFQPTLFERWRHPTSTSAYYVAPVTVQYQAPIVVAQYQPPVVAQSPPCTTCQSPPQQQCSTSYVQRSYYQPVTVMENRTVQEAVTTMRTSYYYDAVTSYRYSMYVDPCSGCAQQVATPTVEYQLKAQSSPVQTWVSRCVQVPVTVQQKVDYWQPQTTCCTTTQGAPIYTSPPPQTQQTQQPPLIQSMPSAPQGQAPSIRQDNAAPKGTMIEQYYPPIQKLPENNGTTGGTSYQPKLGIPVPVPTSNPQTPAPPIKFNQITVNPNSVVEGQVVRSDNTPKGNAKVLFVNASSGKRETATTNSGGRFQLELPAGSWHVYLYGNDGLAVHNSRIDVNGSQSRQVSLVSRSN